MDRGEIALIGYACGHGAKKKGCKNAAKSLKAKGLSAHLNKAGLNSNWQDIYNSPLEKSPHHKPPKNLSLRQQRLAALPFIMDYCGNLCQQVANSIRNNKFPISIGGDHSMAIGTWSGVTTALAAEEEFGLIWFDAHMDSHTISTSHSGSYHGTPLAYLMGYGEDALNNIGSNKPKINPRHLCLIGIRSYEPEELVFLNKLGVRVFFIEEVKEKGLQKTVDEALKIVKSGTKGYGISIDLDFFDPATAPATGSLEPGGVDLPETLTILKQLAADKHLKAVEIAEYNPHLDSDNSTEKLICNVLLSLLV